jgi:hypothetical protein
MKKLLFMLFVASLALGSVPSVYAQDGKKCNKKCRPKGRDKCSTACDKTCKDPKNCGKTTG